MTGTGQAELILLTPDFRVRVSDEPLALLPEVESEVERIWRAEAEANPALFNGSIFSVGRLDAESMEGRFTEYRQFLAQFIKPELFAYLAVRPLAVTAVLRVDGGVVFGRRAGHVLQEPGRWELAPAGGVSADSRRGAQIDYRAQIEQELGEELGLSAGRLDSIRAVAAWEDPETHVVDICLEVRSRVSARGLHKLFRESSDGEYREIKVVPKGELMDFVEKHSRNLVVTAQPFLRACGLLK